jgi:hypothetical protein
MQLAINFPSGKVQHIQLQQNWVAYTNPLIFLKTFPLDKFHRVCYYDPIVMKGKQMTDQDIRDLYDMYPNLTLGQLSKMTGRQVSHLKRILMGGK